MNYVIVEHIDRTKFEKLCEEQLAAGWTPLGGVSVSFRRDNYSSDRLYTQAFTYEQKAA